MYATIEVMLDHTPDRSGAPGTAPATAPDSHPIVALDVSSVHERLVDPAARLDPDAAAAEATRPGVYAWWAVDALPWPPECDPVSVEDAPLYIGIAATRPVGERLRGNHLRSTRVSALRRSLVALLIDELDLHDGVIALPRPGKFHLSPADEAVLSGWMREHLLVSWVAHSSPRSVERALIRQCLPPLNDSLATHSPYRGTLRRLRAEARSKG